MAVIGDFWLVLVAAYRGENEKTKKIRLMFLIFERHQKERII